MMHSVMTVGLMAAVLGLGLALPARAEPEVIPDSALTIEAQFKQTTYWLGAGFGGIWAMWRETLVRYDAVDSSIREFRIPGASGRNRGITAGEGAIWLADAYKNTIFKVDPESGEVLLKIKVQLMQHYEGTIAVGDGAVWVAAPDKGKSWIMRFDAETGDEVARIEVPPSVWAMTIGYGSVWMSGSYKHEVYRIDTATNTLAATIPIPDLPKQITAGEDGVWVVSQETGIIHRIDPATNTVVATFDAGIDEEAKGDITTGGGYVWAAFRRYPLVQIDPATNELLRIYKGATLPGVAVVFAGGSLWTAGWGQAAIYRIAPPE